jgi:hypothetical protein
MDTIRNLPAKSLVALLVPFDPCAFGDFTFVDLAEGVVEVVKFLKGAAAKALKPWQRSGLHSTQT